MRKLTIIITTILLFVMILLSCRKDENSPLNKIPLADAGPDTTIFLPLDSFLLDASMSIDPNGDSVSYMWNKLSWRGTVTITNPNRAKTTIKNLVSGVFEFELTVRDSKGAYSKDTIEITITRLNQCDTLSRPIINARLKQVGVLSQTGIQMAVATAGNKIVFAGAAGNETTANIFDIVSNTWSTAKLSGRDRYWMGSAVVGNKIFFAGGMDGDGMSTDAVDIYDVTNNSWTVTKLSRAANGLAAVTVGNKVLFAGGNWGDYPSGVVDIYDNSTGIWSVDNLSTPRNFISAVSANDKVYFSGGYPLSISTSSKIIDIFDNTTGKWSVTEMQVPRTYHSSVALNNIIYFGGGEESVDFNQGLCSVETLNATTGERRLMKLSGPASWYPGSNAVLMDNKIFFFRLSGGHDSDRFDIYDPTAETWSTGVLPFPILDGASVVSVNNTIYIAGIVSGNLGTTVVWMLEY